MKEQYDILVVGASFSGLTFAHHTESNRSVLVIDQKNRLGAAIESTGLITQKTKDLLDSFVSIDEFIPNQITTIGVISPNYQDYFFSHTDDPWIYSTDTPNLVEAMANQLPAHVECSLSTGLIEYSLEEAHEYPILATVICNGVKSEVRAKCLIGADGSKSKVASLHSRLSKNKHFLLGFEKVFYGDITLGDHPEATIYHFWFGEFSLGYGGWLSPTIINGRKAFRVGLAKLEKDKKDIKKLDDFIYVLQEKQIISIEPKTTCVLSFGHPIPIGGLLKNSSADQVALIGDAAGYCGAFAADGIKGSIISGKIAAEVVEEYLQNGNEEVLSKVSDRVEKKYGLITYYRKQLFYRWLWDQMKRDSTFQAMYTIIAREQTSFLHQFCDSKDTNKSLLRVILKFRHSLHLAKYGILVLRDIIF